MEDLFQKRIPSYFGILTPGMWAPLAYPVPPPVPRHASGNYKKKDTSKARRKFQKQLRAMGGTLALASLPP